MSYKVTGAAAVVELDDGNPELGTGKRIYLEHNVAVPSDAKEAHVEHLLNVGLIEEVKEPAKGKASSKPEATDA